MSRRTPMWAVASAILAATALFLLPLVAHPSWVPYLKGAPFTDLLTAHLPSAWFLHRSLLLWRTIPLWNPTILSGIPFAADPLSGLWYPPLWLAAVWPAPLTFNVLTTAHLAWAGLGMVRLTRRMGLSPLSSLVGAVAFLGAPKLVGHVGLGHISLVMAVCWTPWLLVAAQSLVERLLERGRGIVSASARLGGLLALVFLIDPRWSIPSAVVVLAFLAASWAPWRDPDRHDLRRGIAAVGSMVLVAGAGCAGLALPLLQWLGLSTRTGLAGAAPSYSLPAANFIGLVLPQVGASPEFMVSAGVVVLMLALVGLVERGRDGVVWGVLVAAGWLLALGDGTPLGAVLARIPGWSLLRVPPRWLFVASLGLSILSAFGVEAILHARAGVRLRRGSYLLSAAVVSSVVAFGVGVLALRPAASPVGIGLLLAPSLAAGGFALMMVSPKIPAVAAGIALAGLVLADLWSIDRTLVEVRAPSLDAPATTAGLWVQTEMDGFRLFSPSYAIPQDEAARLGLELADGVHPLQLRAYVDWMANATGFEADAYSVTLPPFPTGDPKDDWGPRLDAARLGLLSVAYAVSDYPLTAPGWVPVETVEKAYIYRNPEARPRAWVEAADGSWKASVVAERSPNRIVVQADGPGRLVLGEIAYPGWKAWIDGHPATIETVDDLLRSVDLASGRHEVRFAFRPTSLYLGLALTIASLAAMVFLWRQNA